MERAVRLPARDPDLHQSRRRPLRPAPRHPALDPGDGGDVRRGRAAVDDHDRSRGSRLGALLHHGHRLSVVGAGPEVSRAGELSRQDVSHRPLAARGCRFHRPARGRDRHRLLGDSVDPDHCRAGPASVRLPADAELQRPGSQCAAGPGVRAAGQGQLRRLQAPGPGVAGRLRDRAQRGLGAGGAGRGAAARVREALEPGRPGLHRHLRGSVDQRGRQRHRRRVLPREDPRGGPRSPGGRAARAQGLSGRHQAHVRRHALLRDLQPRQRHAGRHPTGADRGDHPRRPADAGGRVPARQHRVRHRVRRHDRRAAEHRHPGARRPHAGRGMGGGAEDVPGARPLPGFPTCSPSPARAARRCSAT